jgi:hypothetical protein
MIMARSGASGLPRGAGLGAARDRGIGIDADHVLDLGPGALGIGLRQIHLVQDRDDLDAEIERGVAVGHRLRLHALAGVDNQERALARRKRTADLVREVDVAGRVDQVELVGAAVPRHVLQRGRLRLHFPIGKSPAALDQAIGKRRLAVVDVGDDRKIADLIHAFANVVGEHRGESKTARPFSAKARIAKRCAGARRRAGAKKKARRMNDAPSNKTYGNCLLGLHCMQNTPAATRAKT